ncbi:hypothetical protein [Kordiimonas pumila]|uniref:Uncharacterized protein n=1 Tax=Kordiimonas pumila TaxID=2161677 RepID=A0ABV7D1P6_9PROT|nr:hypothetical protein [Kordiimonas pumila]
MRFAILIAAFGVMATVPAFVPALSPAVYAQSVSQQQAVQAQLIALAQSGDWADFEAIVNTQLAAGRAGMLATIAGNISSMGLAVADNDSNSAVALSLAAMALVDNSSINSADTSLATTVGNNAGAVKAKVARRNPAGAAALASAAARNSAPGLMVAYNAGQSGGQQTGSTNSVVVVRQTPPRPGASEIPVVVEPNPAQSGSPT